MSDSTQVNLRVKTETVERLEKLCKVLFRGKGFMIDYLVAKEWNKVMGANDPNEGYLVTVMGEPAEAEKAAG